MMYAVIRSGNKQFPVRVGSIIKVDRLEHEAGSSFVIDDVIFAVAHGVASRLTITATVLEHRRDEKVLIFKKKRRKNYRRKRGFRHSITILKIMGMDIA